MPPDADHRHLQLARVAWGAVLLLAPRPLLARGGDPSPTVERLTRVLGARHLIEAAILARHRSPVPPRWPVAVDAVHGASMVGLAVCSRRLRRDATVSAVAALLLAGWAELERRRGSSSRVH